MAEKKKPAAERASVLMGLVHLVPQDGEGLALFPVVTDLLSPRWKNGVQTRMPGRVSIKVEGSCYKVSIECPTEGLMTSIQVASLVGLIEALEAAVSGGKAVWSLTYEAAKRSRQTLDPLLE